MHNPNPIIFSLDNTNNIQNPQLYYDFLVKKVDIFAWDLLSQVK